MRAYLEAIREVVNSQLDRLTADKLTVISKAIEDLDKGELVVLAPNGMEDESVAQELRALADGISPTPPPDYMDAIHACEVQDG